MHGYGNGGEDLEEVFVPAIQGVTPEQEDRALDALLADLEHESAEDAKREQKPAPEDEP